MRKRQPWYAVRPQPYNPPPIQGLSRPWIIPQLVQGRGCPAVSSCGIFGRDGEGCGPRYSRPDPGMQQLRAEQGLLTPAPYLNSVPGQPGAGQMLQQQQYVNSTKAGAASASGTTSGTLGLTLAEDEKVKSVSPEALRCYAIWWRKNKASSISCAGYQPGPDPIAELPSCHAPEGMEQYAHAYFRQRGAADRNEADRSYVPDPATALNDFQVAIEECMRAGKSWQECARQGDIDSLRNRALQQGVSRKNLDAAMGMLGKPMEQEALRQGIQAACELRTQGRADCAEIASLVSSAALRQAYWLLSVSGQKLQDKLERDTVMRGSQQFVTSPQQLTQAAVPIMRRTWTQALAALQDAWSSTRSRLGLPAREMDFETPLKNFLLANGWSRAKSHAWQNGDTKVWLNGTFEDFSKVDPATASSTQWPWAATYQNWERNGAKTRSGLFALYALLRLDPLQQALRQGLRDIAVMLADEQTRAR